MSTDAILAMTMSCFSLDVSFWEEYMLKKKKFVQDSLTSEFESTAAMATYELEQHFETNRFTYEFVGTVHRI